MREFSRLPELVSPAADFIIGRAALDHGADSVYVGVDRFNLRAHSPGFSIEELLDFCDLAHGMKRRVFVVFNTMPDDADLFLMREPLQALGRSSAMPDAFVVSDPGVIRVCRELAPRIPLHLSTQTGTFNTESIRFWKAEGISRIVLPREFTLQQIADAAAENICDLEVFVHGAMCVSVSGRCFMGAYMDGRHANRGDCSQPCRLNYTVQPHLDKPDQNAPAFDVEEFSGTTSIFSSRDLCALPLLYKLAAAGVSAFKIEGRNKSVHYISAAVKAYRKAIDSLRNAGPQWCPDTSLQKELDALDHRPYTTGFYDGDLRLRPVFSNKRASRVRMLGLVRESSGEGSVIVDVKNPFECGESIELLPVARDGVPSKIRIGSIVDLAGTRLQRALTSRLVRVHADLPLHVGDILRRKNEDAD